MQRHRRLSLTSALAVLLLSPLATAVAAPSPEKPSGPPEFTPSGQRYDPRATAAVDAAARLGQTLGRAEGFAGVEVSESTGTVTLYRTNPRAAMPVQLAGIAASSTVTVTVLPADHDFATLAPLALELSERLDPTVDSDWYFGASPAVDGSGLTLYTHPSSDLLSMSPEQVSTVLGTPVPIVALKEGGAAPDGMEYLTRKADTSSLNGGARITTASSPGCTTGFSVVDRVTGTTGMLTAAHCGIVGEIVRNDGNARGKIARESVARDIAVIQGYSGGFSNWVYYGTISTNNTRAQGLLLNPSVGTVGCVNGSFSGELCNVKITDSYFTVGGRGPYVVATRTAAGGAGGDGDSGGPFMRWEWDANQERWEARPLGIVSAGNSAKRLPSSSCVGEVSVCFSEVVFANLVSATAGMGFDVRVAG